MAEGISYSEWTERYAIRLVAKAAYDLPIARDMAREGWKQMIEDNGCPTIEWQGHCLTSGHEEPESAVDSELSYHQES